MHKPLNQAIPLLYSHPREMKSLWIQENTQWPAHKYHSSFICKKEKQTFINMQKVKQNFICLHIGILLSNRKETYTSNNMDKISKTFSSVQLLSCVWLFTTPWTAACQASLSNTNSRRLLKLRSIELAMLSKISQTQNSTRLQNSTVYSQCTK